MIKWMRIAKYGELIDYKVRQTIHGLYRVHRRKNKTINLNMLWQHKAP